MLKLQKLLKFQHDNDGVGAVFVHALAPRQKEPTFLVVQLAVTAIFLGIGIFAVKKFRIEPVSASTAWKSSKAS